MPFDGKMKTYSKSELESLVAQLSQAIGLNQEAAEVFASALVDADMHGVSTHGISRLSIYLRRIQAGLIRPNAELKIIHESGSVVVFDADNGLGQVQAVKALKYLMPLAERNGVAAGTIRNSQHFGALSYYCNLAAAQGFILLAMTNCEPAMAPAGGYQPFFGTNPIAASFPTGKEFSVKVDLATSTVARGNIIAAQKKGTSIPPGWALDRSGEPTTDAQEALLGTVLTMAGHKGYALALMVELFSGLLSGAAVGDNVGSMYKNLDRKQNVGHFFCLFRIDAFLDRTEYLRNIDATIDRIKAGSKRPGVEEIFVPGERSARKAQLHRKKGIAVPDETLNEIQQWCSQLNVQFDFDRVS